MELAELIQRLSDPAAYPVAAKAVEVRHTHISVVFLLGGYVYKIKKPVDFSTLKRRRHFCDEEIRLNRRLAPDVYPPRHSSIAMEVVTRHKAHLLGTCACHFAHQPDRRSQPDSYALVKVYLQWQRPLVFTS